MSDDPTPFLWEHWGNMEPVVLNPGEVDDWRVIQQRMIDQAVTLAVGSLPGCDDDDDGSTTRTAGT